MSRPDVTKSYTGKAGGNPGFGPELTFAEVDRRRRIRALSDKLPLDTPIEEVERLEQVRNRPGTETPGTRPDQLYLPPPCDCGHGLSWHADRGYASCTYEGCKCPSWRVASKTPGNDDQASINLNAADSSLRDPAASEYPRPDQCLIEAPAIPAEKQVQREVRQLLIAAGCTVYWLSQARKSGQTKGVPDLYVFHPGRGISFWFECKRPGGSMSDEQQSFQQLCATTNTKHVVGGVDEAV